ncbi:benzoate membrane transport protein [Gemmobacter aquatilis]|uniref:Benzoate membrane transport protein n=2 Tax=Gemmobacter aquatilis TaxID=933059 RepID=A0A1H8HU53_9RHOB|nr:benzoate membrane transport protein [Gemmobacter aquatilis]
MHPFKLAAIVGRKSCHGLFMRLSLISAALVAALVGYGSTIALVLAAAAAVGASPAQTASWVLAICLGKALGSAVLSWRARVPVVLAWSTPGAALIAATEGLSMAEAVGAFVITGILIALTGAVKPLGRLVALIPDGIAAGMLAGVLLPLCLKLPTATQDLPLLILPLIALFALVRLRNPAMAVLAALAAGIVAAFAFGLATLPALTLPLPRLTFIPPDFKVSALIGLALPLYLVTMASQNLPGFATLRAAGYEPPVRAGLTVTGGISAVIGLFGAHTISMAAITAAICLGDDVHPDRHRRWIVGLVYAAVWVLLGLLSPLILTLLAALPAPLITAIVALALLGPFMGAATGAFAAPDTRFAAAITLAVTASGAPALGIGAAFWGLLAGLAFHMLERLKR